MGVQSDDASMSCTVPRRRSSLRFVSSQTYVVIPVL